MGEHRITGLDRARAIAALSVMLAHVAPPFLPPGLTYIFTGHPAVIAFFVVSGFCIHYPYVGQAPAVTAFLAGRYIRIGIPLCVALLWAKWQAGTNATLRGFNLIDGFIVWSVVCELIYYSLYPALRQISERVGWVPMFAVSVVASYVVAIGVGSDSKGNANVYGPQLNWLVSMPAWLLGCILAEMIARGTAPKISRVWLMRAVTAGTASTLYWLMMNTPVGFYLTMMPFAGLVFFWLLAEIQTRVRTPIADWIGGWSYSIYLFHIPAFHIPAVFLLEDTIPKPLAVLLILPVCYVMYLAFERPAHQLARAVRRRLSQKRASPAQA